MCIRDRQGKRFGFRLEEIRVLLNLYNKDDQQQAQLSETYRLSVIHLEEMIARRDELDAAIIDLQDEMQTVSTLIDQKVNGAPPPHLQHDV